MGYGSWSSSVYDSARVSNKKAGKSDFHYSDTIRSGKVAAEVNELLDPTTKAGKDSPFAGTVMRECAVSVEHPNPTPIVVVLDVTGSNLSAAKKVHAKLPQLLGVLQRTGGIEDPQIMLIFVGDAYSDAVPLQIGQFESDNKIDAMLEAAYLEGGGGGGNHENYELAGYYLWKHTHLESFAKEGRKGYVFFIGDERTYDKVTNDYGSGWRGISHTLESLLGDKLQEDIPVKEVFDGMQEQYEVYHLFQRQGSYEPRMVQPHWQKLIPAQNSMVLDNPNTVCEAIAGILAMVEAGMDADAAAGALVSAGFDKDAVKSVSKTLATVNAGAGGAVATTEGSLDLGDASKGTSRL